MIEQLEMSNIVLQGATGTQPGRKVSTFEGRVGQAANLRHVNGIRAHVMRLMFVRDAGLPRVDAPQ
jgi:hypothetical protein